MHRGVCREWPVPHYALLHPDRLEAELDRWAARVRDGMSQEAFVDAALADAGDDSETYDRVAPFWQSWQGLRRYWDTR